MAVRIRSKISRLRKQQRPKKATDQGWKPQTPLAVGSGPAVARAKASQWQSCRGEKMSGLSRTALQFLVANSPTPKVFDEAPEEPPFDLLDE